MLVAGLAVATPSSGHVIAIDVGHSIASQGAISARGVAEFEFNRALALVVEQTLAAAGYRPFLIGADGRTEDLVSRPRRAGEARAGLFVSVHHDSAKARFQRDWIHDGRPRKYLDDRFRGFSIFVSRNNVQWPLALRCASAIGARMIAGGFRASRYHADPVLGSGREFADEANGVHFYDNLAVLRHAPMPALLFEAGVIVNRDEELALGRAETRAGIARALGEGMGDCGFRT
ncbi:MAG: N-acetylmuramoyl-L-alanine amidase [Burkholderiales bacterium]|nr:N-acetylmuramoyl-L-alanine amidase [Burkholderiales bacterium]